MYGSIQVHSFLASMAAKNRSTCTVRSYRASLERFGRFVFGRDSTLIQTKPEDIEAWILALRESKLSEATVSSRVAAVKAFFKWAEQRDLVARDPGRRISFVPRSSLPKDPDIGAARALLDSLDLGTWIGSRDRAIFLTLYGTGCRVSELCGIRIRDIIGKEVRVLGKGNKERICQLSDQALQAVDHWKLHHRSERMPKTDFLFVSAEGIGLNPGGVQAMMDRRRKLTGINQFDLYPSGFKRSRLSPHAFRHLFATQLLENEVELRVIQELLGHTNIATTQRYTRVSMRLRKRGHDLLPNL